jgi:hypothetical protein
VKSTAGTHIVHICPIGAVEAAEATTGSGFDRAKSLSCQVLIGPPATVLGRVLGVGDYVGEHVNLRSKREMGRLGSPSRVARRALIPQDRARSFWPGFLQGIIARPTPPCARTAVGEESPHAPDTLEGVPYTESCHRMRGS